MKLKVKILKEIEGDFYVAYFKDMKNKKGDRSALYFAKNDKQVKKAESAAHGEPVIIEKIIKKDIKNYKSKDSGNLKDSLEFQIRKDPNQILPICVGVYVD